MFDALTALVARIRASTWAVFLVKGVLIACGLGFLAWLGGGARFRPTERAPPVVATPEPFDAGVADARPIEPSAVVVQTTPAPPATTHAGRATPDDPVYLNEAGIEDLRRLPGVGPKRAEAILAHRRHVGRFTRVEDLLRVKGVGRATIKKWRPLVRFDARPSTADAGSG